MWRNNISVASPISALSPSCWPGSWLVIPPAGLASLVPGAADPLLVPAPNLTISASLSPTLNHDPGRPHPFPSPVTRIWMISKPLIV